MQELLSFNLTLTWQNQKPEELLTQVGEWLETTDPDLAVEYFRAATHVNPTYSLAWYRLGDLLLKNGKYTDAVKALEHAVNLTPEHHPTWYKLALAHKSAGDMQAAESVVNEVLRLCPTHPGALLLRLQLLAQQAQWEDIIRLFHEMPEDLRRSKEVRQMCAEALSKSGRDSD